MRFGGPEWFRVVTLIRDISEKAAENGVLSQTRGPRRFKLALSLLLQAWTVLRLCSVCLFLAFFPPPQPKKTSYKGTYFGSST
jgi:hypothetical protein